jgi:hypothetical protein
MSKMPLALSQQDRDTLLRAYGHLEYPSFAARLSSVIGTPIELALKLLPKDWYFGLHRSAETVIEKSLHVAIASLNGRASILSSRRYHKALGFITGAVGGFFGGPALVLELPLTTAIMLRTIADIARSEGEDLGSLEARLACVQVFALGGRSKEDDAADTGYYGIRLALEAAIGKASRFVAVHGMNNRAGAPVPVRLIANIAERFGVVLSEKASVELVPVVGAVGGAFINGVFIQHFQDVAWSHFTIRRLERKYSPVLVQAEYEKLVRTRGKHRNH